MLEWLDIVVLVLLLRASLFTAELPPDRGLLVGPRLRTEIPIAPTVEEEDGGEPAEECMERDRAGTQSLQTPQMHSVQAKQSRIAFGREQDAQ